MRGADSLVQKGSAQLFAMLRLQPSRTLESGLGQENRQFLMCVPGLLCVLQGCRLQGARVSR